MFLFYMSSLFRAKCYLSPRSVLLPICPICTLRGPGTTVPGFRMPPLRG